jgi:hypothetical protein
LSHMGRQNHVHQIPRMCLVLIVSLLRFLSYC